MGIDRLAPEEILSNLIKHEKEYYVLLAICSLIQEGYSCYSQKEINERSDYIRHHFPELSILLNPLTDKELFCIYHASCGKEVKETAYKLGVSEGFIKQLRTSACHKLRATKMGTALTRAIKLGYLPLRDESSFLHSPDKEFSINFQKLKKVTKNYKKIIETEDIENTV